MKAFNFFNRIKSFKNNKIFKFSFNKSFSSSSKYVYLNQNEALMMNEHDRILSQLENNAIPEANMKNVIQELTNYCESLSQYKDYMKGWDHISDYFSKNVEKLSNQELINNLQTLTGAGYIPENTLVLNRLYDNLLTRQIPQQDFLNAVYGAGIIRYNGPHFWRGVIDKIQSYNLSTLEAANLIVSLADSGVNKNDKIFETLSEKLNNVDFAKFKEHELISLFFAISNLLQNEELKSKALEFIMNNYSSFNFHALPVIAIAAENLNIGEDNLSKLVLEIAKNYKHLNQITRFDFYKNLLTWCNKYPNLLSKLKDKNSLYSMPLPELDTIKAFSELNDISDDKQDLKQQSYNEFYEKYAESMGFNPEFAKDFNFLNSDVFNEMRSNILVEEKH